MNRRIRFTLNKRAPEPYDFRALQRYMRAESKRLQKKIATFLLAGSPWIDLLFTGGTFQVFLGKKKPSWLSGEPVNGFRFPNPRDL